MVSGNNLFIGSLLRFIGQGTRFLFFKMTGKSRSFRSFADKNDGLENVLDMDITNTVVGIAVVIIAIFILVNV